MTQPAGRKWLVAMLIDEAEMVDDDDQPLTTPAAVLAYLDEDLGGTAMEIEAKPALKVIGPGQGAEEAFEGLPGLQG